MQKNTRTKPAAGRGGAGTDTIVERITAAIGEHRLPPGTKLGEEHLGGIFGVSRTKVRQALFRLAADKLVTLSPGRGAFVAQPSVREAREVFEARRLLESGIIARFVRVATPEQIARLRQQIALERQAVADKALHTGTRSGTQFLGQFHYLIADLLGNRVLAELLRELASRTSLIEVLYESSMTPACSADEHAQLLASIERGDPEEAARLMDRHLEHIERSLNLRDAEAAEVDLRAVLGDGKSPPAPL